MANTGNDMNDFRNAADAMSEFRKAWEDMLQSSAYKDATKYPIMSHPMCGCGSVVDLSAKKLTMKSVEEATKRVIDEYGKPQITWNHDRTKPIGRLIRTGVGEYTFDFIPDITPKEIKIDIKVEDVGTGTCANKLIEGLKASGYFDAMNKEKELKRPKRVEYPSLDREFEGTFEGIKIHSGGRGHSKMLPYEEVRKIYDKFYGPNANEFITPSEQRILMGVDFAREDSESTSISMFKVNGETLEQIQLSKKSGDMEFTAWQEYLAKLACSTYGIGPSIINNVTEQKSKNMSSIAIKITNDAEFRGVEKYLLIGGAYWNGKTKNESYNDGKTLRFKNIAEHGDKCIPPYPTHYFITLSQDDLQMNMYEGTSAAEQSIRRAGYMMINTTQFKSVVTVSQEAEQLMESFFAGIGRANITRGMQVDLYPLFNRNNFASDDYRRNVTEESGKKKSAPLPYIDMFEVADIVNTTTKTTVTKLLAALGTQNTKKSSGICLSDKSIKSITK